ncbi:MAG TPA: hypothetical protein VIL69_01510 [Roseomonas sp.]|jgi:hypothetical protein
MRLLSAAITLLLLAGCAGTGMKGEKASASLQQTALQEIEALPVELGPLRRTGAPLNFEAQSGGAGLGASARYAPSNGERIAVTVYIYDRGQRRAPDGAESPEAVEELRKAAAELNLAARVGTYRSVKFNTGSTMGRSGGSPAEIRCANFNLVQRDGAPTGDSICLTVQQGRFVKVRLTIWNPPEPILAGTMAAAILQSIRGIRAGGGEPGPGLRT